MARKNKKTFSTKDLIFIALMAALICVLAPLSIPGGSVSGVPITLGTFAVYLTAAVLGHKKGTLCVVIYLLLGAVGVPVFAGWTGGFHKFAAASGGYLIGYIPLVFIAGLIIESNPHNTYMYFIGMIAGTLVCYLFGSLWLAFIMKLSLKAALTAGVVPYIAADCVKIFAAAMLGYPLRSGVKKITG